MINVINKIVKFAEHKNGNGYKAPFVTVIYKNFKSKSQSDYFPNMNILESNCIASTYCQDLIRLYRIAHTE